MAETNASAYTNEVFARVLDSALGVEVLAHEWSFVQSDEWELHNGSRELIEDFAATRGSASAAIDVIQKPHHYIDDVVEYIKDNLGFEARYAIEKFGEWQCDRCFATTTNIEDYDEECSE